MDTEQGELVCEDQLPNMTKKHRAEWFAQSQIVDGVRMGPPVDPRIAAIKRRIEADDNYHFFRSYLGLSR